MGTLLGMLTRAVQAVSVVMYPGKQQELDGIQTSLRGTVSLMLCSHRRLLHAVRLAIARLAMAVK